MRHIKAKIIFTVTEDEGNEERVLASDELEGQMDIADAVTLESGLQYVVERILNDARAQSDEVAQRIIEKAA